MGRGKLKFKGEEKAKKKKKSSSKKQLGDGVGALNGGGDDAINIDTSSAGTESSTTQQQSVAAAATNSAHQTNSNESAASSTSMQKSPQISQGQGTITTSSTVVTGHGTSFKAQIHVGDALLAQTSKGEEMRVIKMVLSPVSISISSAFTTDLKTPTQFKYINKPRDVTRESQAKVAKARMEQEEVEQRAMGTYGKKGEITYRERTEHGSYRIKREQATTDMTRSDLLSVRAKKKSDRYC